MKRFLALFALTIALTCIPCYLTIQHYKEKAKHTFDVKIPINKISFNESLNKNVPEWIERQVENDLSFYKQKGLCQKDIDTLFSGENISKLNLIRFTIQNRHISFSLSEKNLESRQFRHLLKAMQTLNEMTHLPNVDFVVSLEDGFIEEINLPLFVYAKKKSVQSLILIPDFKALTGYPRLIEEMKQGAKKYPWEKKDNLAFWRGATTGGWLTASNWDQFARTKLVLLSLKNPQKIDARVNGIVQCTQEVPEIIKKSKMCGKTVSQLDHLKYKYLVDVDGNSFSFERYFWTLLSNSLVLKQITPNIQWYYGALKPYVHFVPVDEDLSNLISQLDWAKEHDEEAKKISQNATEFVKKELSIETTFLYLFHLLESYAKLFNLEMTIGPKLKVQDFDLESLETGGDHSPLVKAPPVSNDYQSKDCALNSYPIAVSRFKESS